MRFEHLLIGFVIFSLVIISGTMMIGDVDERYDFINLTNSTSEFTGVYNTIQNMSDIATNVNEDTLEGDVAESTSWESLIQGSYSAIRFIKDSFGLFSNITNAMATTLGLEAGVFTNAAYIALTVTVLFSIIYLVFRFMPRN